MAMENEYMATLTLIPTPLDMGLPLEEDAARKISGLLQNYEKNKVFILVEELKCARRRWVQWSQTYPSLKKEFIEHFIPFNEHSREEVMKDIMPYLKKGAKAFLLSDCGLPGFCDPGSNLIYWCQKQGLKVRMSSFPNSLMQSLVLSGFSCDQFFCGGMLPKSGAERVQTLRKWLQMKVTCAFLETPYRLKKLILEFDCIQDLLDGRHVFFAFDLNQKQEDAFWGNWQDIRPKLLEQDKREFVVVIEGEGKSRHEKPRGNDRKKKR